MLWKSTGESRMRNLHEILDFFAHLVENADSLLIAFGVGGAAAIEPGGDRASEVTEH